jgi:hypothetical protein
MISICGCGVFRVPFHSVLLIFSQKPPKNFTEQDSSIPDRKIVLLEMASFRVPNVWEIWRNPTEKWKKPP